MRLTRAGVAAITASAALTLLAACGEDATTDTGGTATDAAAEADAGADTEGAAETAAGATQDADAFPVTIEHAFGQTTIEAAPERVATVAWSNHEVPLALGVVPVGMSRATWGDDDGDGVLPWVEEQLAELGGQTPVLFDETDGIDFEAVADTDPDVILAAYSGLTQEEYDTLSQIAPVVAYPETAWTTSMTDMIDLNSQALGLAEEGQQLVADLEAQVAEVAEAHPELADTTALFAWVDANDLSQIGYYTTGDPRAGLLEQLGMGVPALVAQTSPDAGSFFQTVSAESADSFEDVDLIVTYGAADGSVEELLTGDPLLSTIPAVEQGRVLVLEDDTPLAASANPSPLSVGWGLEDYVDQLTGALATSPR